MVTYLRVDLVDALKNLKDTKRAHAKFAFLDNMYKHHMDVIVEDDSDDAHARYHTTCALRSYFKYLVDTSIFVDKNVYYFDLV